MLVYEAFNKEVFQSVPINAMHILDVGCGAGLMGKALKELVPKRVITGLTYSKDEKDIALKYLDDVLLFDINNDIPILNKTFDCIIFSHILEHTYNPITVLKGFKKFLTHNGILIVAVPNILFYQQRIKFIKGDFKYSEQGGLTDVTHFRFFDWDTVTEMIEKSGFHIIEKKAFGNFPVGPLRNKATNIAIKIDQWFVAKYPGLFGFQFVITAKN